MTQCTIRCYCIQKRMLYVKKDDCCLYSQKLDTSVDVFTQNLVKLKVYTSRTSYHPVLGVLGFLSKKTLRFLAFLAKILAITLGKFCKISQDFSRSGKEIQKMFGLLGKKTKNIQNLGKRNKSCIKVIQVYRYLISNYP